MPVILQRYSLKYQLLAMEEPFSRAELAQRAAQDVAVVAGNLQRKLRGSWFKNHSNQKRTKNLAILAASLMCISFNQDKYEQAEHKHKQDDEAVKLETFLCGLELVCTVRNPIFTYERNLSIN
ncbi:hypothetical protein ACHAPE_000769 [Trichoderma viride]